MYGLIREYPGTLAGMLCSIMLFTPPCCIDTRAEQRLWCEGLAQQPRDPCTGYSVLARSVQVAYS